MEVKFNEKTYTETSLKEMTVEDLLALRNEVAVALGVPVLEGFKDHTQAVGATQKALERFASSAATPKEKVKAEKKVREPKPPKEKKERGMAKSAEAKHVKRPTREMFSTIKKVGEWKAGAGREHRWPNYKDGMMIIEIIEGVGTEPWDVTNWKNVGIMEVIAPTDDEYAARKKAWYLKEGRTDPDEEKALKEQQKADARKAREEAKAKAAADAEAARQAKAAEEAAKQAAE